MELHFSKVFFSGLICTVKILRQRWISQNSRICANGHAMTLHLRGKGCRWKFGSRDCRTKFSLRTDMWLKGLKLGYREIILFIYYWSKDYTKIIFVREELQIAKEAVIDFNNHLWEVSAAGLIVNLISIGVSNMTAEGDESLFGTNHCLRDGKTTKIACCRNTGVGWMMDDVVKWRKVLYMLCVITVQLHLEAATRGVTYRKVF